MKILDYIFYRLYKAYDVKNDFPLSRSITYLIIDIFLVTWPFCGLLIDMLQRKEHDNTTEIIGSINVAIITSLVNHRYKKKDNREKIFKRYKNSKWNKIPSFFFYFILLAINLIIGVGGYILVRKNIVYPFNLEGIVWRLF